MFDVEKAKEHYSALAAFAADVDLMASAAPEDEENEFESVRLLANRLAKKWRNVIGEQLIRQQFGNGAEAAVAAPAAKAKAGVRVLKDEEA